MKCPECGGARIREEKYTGDGFDHRSYVCLDCKWTHDESRGVAMWKVIHDATDAKQGDSEDKKSEPDDAQEGR